MTARTPRTVLRLLRTSQPHAIRTTTRTLSILRQPYLSSTTQQSHPRSILPSLPHTRAFTTTTPLSTPSPADTAIETITDLYGTAVDEFEMAVEETEKNTTYAAEDRAAARAALDQLLKYYNQVVVEEGDKAVAEEVRNRVGGRIRELEQAVLGLEESVARGD